MHYLTRGYGLPGHTQIARGHLFASGPGQIRPDPVQGGRHGFQPGAGKPAEWAARGAWHDSGGLPASSSRIDLAPNRTSPASIKDADLSPPTLKKTRYEAFPDVCRLSDGRLMAVFYAGYGHVALPNEDLPKGGRIKSIIHF